MKINKQVRAPGRHGIALSPRWKPLRGFPPAGKIRLGPSIRKAAPGQYHILPCSYPAENAEGLK